MIKNSAFYIAMQTGRTPLAMSWPGCAKSASLISFAHHVNRRLYILIGSIREPSDFGIPFLAEQNTKTATNGPPTTSDVAKMIKEAKTHNEKQQQVQAFLSNKGDVVAECDGEPHPVTHEIPHFVLAAPKWAADTFSGEEWIIGLDELTCCPPAVQAGMLRFIAENWVGDLEMPSNIWKCALANPTELATNGFEIEPAMANRMIHLDWEMDWDSWDVGMQAGGNFPPPQYPVVPDGWEKDKALIGSMFSAFRKFRPDAFRPPTDEHGTVTMTREQMSKAWPSPRSWDIAMDCRAAGKAAGVDPLVLLQLMQGCVGAAGQEYDTWETNLDLPDPKVVLNATVKALKANKPIPYDHPNRPDKVIAFLSSLYNHVMGDQTDKKRYNKERWEGALMIMKEASVYDKDIAISCCTKFFKNADGSGALPPGADVPDEFMELFPTIYASFNT